MFVNRDITRHLILNFRKICRAFLRYTSKPLNRGLQAGINFSCREQLALTRSANRRKHVPVYENSSRANVLKRSVSVF